MCGAAALLSSEDPHHGTAMYCPMFFMLSQNYGTNRRDKDGRSDTTNANHRLGPYDIFSVLSIYRWKSDDIGGEEDSLRRRDEREDRPCCWCYRRGAITTGAFKLVGYGKL